MTESEIVRKASLLKKKGQEAYFAVSKGGLFITEVAPIIIVKSVNEKGEEEILLSSRGLNYYDLTNALLRILFLGETEVRKRLIAGTGTVFFNLKEDGTIEIHIKGGKTQGAIYINNEFKRAIALKTFMKMRDTIPEITITLEDSEGKTFRIARRYDKVFFSFDRFWIEIPEAERFMIQESIKHYFQKQKKEFRPFLATVAGATNNPESFIFFGFKDFKIKNGEDEKLIDLLSIM